MLSLKALWWIAFAFTMCMLVAIAVSVLIDSPYRKWSILTAIVLGVASYVAIILRQFRRYVILISYIVDSSKRRTFARFVRFSVAMNWVIVGSAALFAVGVMTLFSGYIRIDAVVGLVALVIAAFILRRAVTPVWQTAGQIRGAKKDQDLS